MEKLHHVIPLSIPILGGITVVTTYIMSTQLGHMPHFLPTISETGDVAPESCIFTWGMSNVSFLFGILVLFRYLQISTALNQEAELYGKSIKTLQISNKFAVSVIS